MIKNKEPKLKNQTKLTLCSEKEGGIGMTGPSILTRLPIVYRVNQPLYPKGHYPTEFYDVGSNGVLHKIFDANIAEGMGMHQWVCRAHGVTLLACDGREIIMQPDSINYTSIISLYIFSDDGQLIDKLDAAPYFDAFTQYTKPIILDDSRFFVGGKCYNFRKRKLEWSYPAVNEKSQLYPVVLPNKNLMFHYGENDKYHLCILENSGKLIKQITYPSRPEWFLTEPVVYKNNILNIFSTENINPGDSWKTSRLICCDDSLNELWHYDFPNSAIFSNPTIDQDSGILYFQRTPKITTAFDIEKRSIVTESAPVQHKFRTILSFLPGVGLLCRKESPSSIDVLDFYLQPISHHRLKGIIYFSISQDKRLFVLSYRPEKCDWYIGKDGTRFCKIDKPGHTYVYELKS